MNSFFLIASLLSQPADSQAIAQLFQVLDVDGNGRISSNELSEAQKPYFVRALRVSDRNEDGQLSKEELANAASDPEPMKPERTGGATVSRFGSRATSRFDPASLDRNRDGFISKAEIPVQFQSRFKQVFEKAGSDRVSVETMKRLLGYSQMENPNRGDDSSRKKTEGAPNSKTQASTAMQSSDSFFDRLDRNKDGLLQSDEIPSRMRQALRRIDSNNDRAVSKKEFAQMAKARLQREGLKK